jgi:hypothetical protein
MMLPSLVRPSLLVLVLVVMMLTLPTLSYLLWSLPFHLWLQLLTMMTLLYWQGSFVPCTSSTRRGGDHPRAASSAVTPFTSSPIAPRGRNLTPPICMTTPTRTTIATRATKTRRTASKTLRRSSRRSCPEHVLP